MTTDGDLALYQHETPEDQTSSKPSKTQPILKPLKQDNQTLLKCRLYCNVLSVSYFDGKDAKKGKCKVDASRQACAVLFEVTFDSRDRTLQHAMVPTCVVDAAIDVFTFPDPNESIKMSDRTINNTMTFSPTAQTPVGGGSLGTLSHQELKYAPEYLHLEKFIQFRDNDVEIRWHFINDRSRYFPSTVRLLVVATKQSALPFPFKLRILPTLKVCLGPTKWLFWSRVFAPAQGHHGWAFSINADHNPGDAKEAFDECQMASKEGKFSQVVGLRPAIYSYFKEGKDV